MNARNSNAKVWRQFLIVVICARASVIYLFLYLAYAHTTVEQQAAKQVPNHMASIHM